MKKNNQLSRIKDVVLTNRLDVNDGFLQVFNIDLLNLIQQYFYIIGEPSVNIDKENKVFNVSISFQSTQLKHFSIMQDYV